ncbi:MAG: hypothetical protein GF365_02700 [Candidatus Buchananbacteria bacterium]|nr:hypothetical protein [Candidatus Buchananbacteria bacterium]
MLLKIYRPGKFNCTLAFTGSTWATILSEDEVKKIKIKAKPFQQEADNTGLVYAFLKANNVPNGRCLPH